MQTEFPLSGKFAASTSLHHHSFSVDSFHFSSTIQPLLSSLFYHPMHYRRHCLPHILPLKILFPNPTHLLHHCFNYLGHCSTTQGSLSPLFYHQTYCLHHCSSCSTTLPFASPLFYHSTTAFIDAQSLNPPLSPQFYHAVSCTSLNNSTLFFHEKFIFKLFFRKN